MARCENHYEAAFEAYLRWLGIPYVAVLEAHRAGLPGRTSRTLKSFDFLVCPPGQTTRWLVEVKGRQFPTGGHQFWRNWATWDELESLAQWEAVWGEQALGLLVFAYQVVGQRAPLPPEELLIWHGRLYGFVGIRSAYYQALAQPLSRRWRTATLATELFRQLARPLRTLWGMPLPQREPPPGGRAYRSDLSGRVAVGCPRT